MTGPVTLFEGRQFTGSSVTLGVGDTRFLTPDDFNDRAVSIQVAPGHCAMLFADANANGGFGISIDLLEDCPDLSVYGFDKQVSYVRVFQTPRDTFVWARGALRDGQYIPGHWERQRANGSVSSSRVAAVSPPLPAPTTPQPHTDGGVVVRDHRGDEPGGVRPPPDVDTSDAVVHDHRASRIKHVFVLMLENRSFDHMLGFSAITGTDAATGRPTSIEGLTGNESNSHAGVTYRVVRGAPDRAPHGPGHNFNDVLEQLCGAGATYVGGNPYPAIHNSGFVSNQARSHADTPDAAMRCFTPEQVPVITALAREFVVCDHWFSSMPGPTEPNRWFVHAATAGSFDESPSSTEIAESILLPWGGFKFENGTLFDQLQKAKIKYRIYACDDFPNVAELEGVSRTFDIDDFEDFAGDVASASYDAAYTFIEPSYDALSDFEDGNSQHPLGSVRAGEILIKKTYEALRRSPIWGSSMLIITYDEHGGFYDHVPPPAARATGSKGSKHGFTFDQLGPRVPAIVVSPLIPRNLIDHRRYEHSSVVSTLMDLHDLGALTARSRSSSGLNSLATLATPRQDAPLTLPAPAAAPAARLATAAPIMRAEVRKADWPLADDQSDPIGATLRSALAQHLEFSAPGERPAIVARVKALRTRGEASRYLKEVSALVRSARAKAGIRRSATVRDPERTLA